jgi:hypothetical protein
MQRVCISIDPACVGTSSVVKHLTAASPEPGESAVYTQYDVAFVSPSMPTATRLSGASVTSPQRQGLAIVPLVA